MKFWVGVAPIMTGETIIVWGIGEDIHSAMKDVIKRNSFGQLIVGMQLVEVPDKDILEYTDQWGNVYD